MKDYNWRKEANVGIRWSIGWVFLGVILILALGAGIWGLTVFLSGPRGQGDAIIQNNSAENWTAAQATFEELYTEVVATDAKITVAAAALAQDPNDKTLSTNYYGMINHCLSVVGEYNAEARKFLSEDWKAADLPDQISNLDPQTDCKE